MADQAKFQKMLEILLILDCKYGRTIQEISDRFDVSPRTVYRYFDTFKQVRGFVIENNNGYFKIDKEESTSQDISQLLHFTEEDAFILGKAIHSKDDDNYLLTTEVGNFLGVGRFVLGLPDEIEVVYPQTFKDYLNEKMEKNSFK